MVKILRRLRTRNYKGKQAIDTQFIIEFPRKLNNKIEPHWEKHFDKAEVNSQETDEKETFHILLTRYKRKLNSAPAH